MPALLVLQEIPRLALEELTIAEIGRRLSISVEAAKSLLRRARAAARQQLIGDPS